MSLPPSQGLTDNASTSGVVTPARWQQVWNSLGARGGSGAVFEHLHRAWSQPHRHYHNLEHLQECLMLMDSVADQVRQPAVLEAAIWFHDAVYDARRSDNEERSAEEARSLLSAAGISEGLITDICRLILVTRNHVPDDTTDAALLCDIDLAILGQDPVRIDRYEHGIRQEYSWVPEADYVKGRSQVLRRFLDRDHLYITEPFILRFENKARCNLRLALEKLGEQITL